MTLFNARMAATHFVDPPSSASSRSSSVATENAMSHYFGVDNLSQADWSHSLAAAGIGFELDENGFPAGNTLHGTCHNFEANLYDESMYSPDIGSVDMSKAERQARRKAQNRAAQRKFRERKDCQLKALEAEIAELRVQIQGSRDKIADLEGALTEAKTQVEILKSILPSIAKSSGNASHVSLDGLRSQEGGSAILSALLASLLKGSVENDSGQGSNPTPESPQSHSEDAFLYS